MEKITARYIPAEASSSFEEKLNRVIREMSAQGYVYKEFHPIDTHSVNKASALVLFEKKWKRPILNFILGIGFFLY